MDFLLEVVKFTMWTLPHPDIWTTTNPKPPFPYSSLPLHALYPPNSGRKSCTRQTVVFATFIVILNLLWAVIENKIDKFDYHKMYDWYSWENLRSINSGSRSHFTSSGISQSWIKIPSFVLFVFLVGKHILSPPLLHTESHQKIQNIARNEDQK